MFQISWLIHVSLSFNATPDSPSSSSSLQRYLLSTTITAYHSLVDDVFGKDNQGKVQIEKVVMLIWQFRDDHSVVAFMAQFVSKVSCSSMSDVVVVHVC